MDGKVGGDRPVRAMKNLRHWFGKAPVANQQMMRWLELMVLLLLFSLLLVVVWLALP